MKAEIQKSGSHIPNSVGCVVSRMLILYPIENKSLICLVEVQFLESKLLENRSGSLSSRLQVSVFK
jgi:hypothetical protein